MKENEKMVKNKVQQYITITMAESIMESGKIM